MKSGEAHSSVVDKLFEVVGQCKGGHFTQAQQTYMSLAIGNKAWPMGVGRLSHVRAARSGIEETSIDHILNEEHVRK